MRIHNKDGNEDADTKWNQQQSMRDGDGNEHEMGVNDDGNKNEKE